MKLPMQVVFGPNPGSYYVACGRNLEFKDMPVAFTDKMKEFTVVSWSWISMGSNCETWVARNAENDTFYFNTGLNTDIHSYLTGKNDRTQAQFVSFAPESGYWCVKHNLNGWNAYVSKSSEKKILEMQARVQGFDGGLKGILFGHRDSHIYMFQAGFAYNLEGDAENAEHPLHKAGKFAIQMAQMSFTDPCLLNSAEYEDEYDQRSLPDDDSLVHLAPSSSRLQAVKALLGLPCGLSGVPQLGIPVHDLDGITATIMNVAIHRRRLNAPLLHITDTY
ncbi:hypothetical protein FRC18_000337 [Serendipita sp. 400]|nr:hypothetical protein FRC18_000337 [Serendipita sp. 400]